MSLFQYIKIPSFPEMLSGLAHLVYPSRCQICGNMLEANDNDYVCSNCIKELPRTGFESQRGNFVEQKFWGLTMIYSAFSGYYFRRGERLRLIIHAFKYHGRKDVAQLMGRQLGLMMLQSGFHKDYDFLIPIPLHPQKTKQRGYNQTAEIAKGISEITGMMVREDILFRIKVGQSQTKKNRFDRWTDIQDTYVCESPERHAGARLLIVDDVLTTGSTIEVCYKALAKIPYVRIGVVTLAVVDSRR